jgi:type VI secretion system protein ImpM
MGQPPGFFGKLPSHGDFVGRRLPPPVRDCFDRWLQGALVQSRIDLGDAWLPTWLSSPLWRFVAGPGVCGEQAWAGVMLPSHDRVGRCFPLLLAAGIDGAPALADCLTLHDGWFGRIEELALAALQEEFSVDDLDAALAATGSVPPSQLPTCTPARPPPAPARTRVSLAAGGTSAAHAGGSLDGRSAWWSDGSPLVAPSLAICSGLPSPETFAALLDGGWQERGWASPHGAPMARPM